MVTLAYVGSIYDIYIYIYISAADYTQHGYLSEHHSTGETAQKAGDYAEDLAMEMLATTLGLPNDPTLTWDQREEQWKLSGKIYKTH